MSRDHMPRITRIRDQVLDQLLPGCGWETPEAFVSCQLATLDPDGNAQMKTALSSASGPVLREIRETLSQRLAEETAREAGVMARAQSLFNILSVYGFIATAVTGMLANGSVPWWIMAVPVTLALWQVVSAMVNILGATHGIPTPALGTSDLITWAHAPETAGLHRMQIPTMIEIYRHRSLIATWRFERLRRAQNCFRNLVILSMVILLLQLFRTPGPEILGRFLFA